MSGGPGASGDARDNGFFRVIGAQGFEPGKSFLVRRPGGDILSPLDLVSFPLQPGKQIFQAGGHGDQPVDGGFQFCLITGAVLCGLMLNIALALIPAGDNDGQTTLLSDPVTSAADLMVASLVGVVVPVILETDRIEDPVIISMVLVNVKGVDILASAGTLGFGSLKICVQVKSTDAPVDWRVLDGRCDEKLWCRIRLVSVMERFQIFHYQ